MSSKDTVTRQSRPEFSDHWSDQLTEVLQRCILWLTGPCSRLLSATSQVSPDGIRMIPGFLVLEHPWTISLRLPNACPHPNAKVDRILAGSPCMLGAGCTTVAVTATSIPLKLLLGPAKSNPDEALIAAREFDDDLPQG